MMCLKLPSNKNIFKSIWTEFQYLCTNTDNTRVDTPEFTQEICGYSSQDLISCKLRASNEAGVSDWTDSNVATMPCGGMESYIHVGAFKPNAKLYHAILNNDLSN